MPTQKLQSPDLLAFDADDTLWHNETFFAATHARLLSLLAPYAPQDIDLKARLDDVERRNLRHFGYGVKGFTLSMIETAVQVTEDRVPASLIGAILEFGKEMMAHPVELLPGVAETLETLAGRYRLLLVTKGDLFHQESKVARSGLADFFSGVEIVSEKDTDTYARILRRYDADPAASVMIGNSVRSDILPMLALGGWAVHIPYHITWTLEQADLPEVHPRLRQVPEISRLLDLLPL
jgi:putative hydrolase of the HAD superfamily